MVSVVGWGAFIIGKIVTSVIQSNVNVAVISGNAPELIFNAMLGAYDWVVIFVMMVDFGWYIGWTGMIVPLLLLLIAFYYNNYYSDEKVEIDA